MMMMFALLSLSVVGGVSGLEYCGRPSSCFRCCCCCKQASTEKHEVIEAGMSDELKAILVGQSFVDNNDDAVDATTIGNLTEKNETVDDITIGKEETRTILGGVLGGVLYWQLHILGLVNNVIRPVVQFTFSFLPLPDRAVASLGPKVLHSGIASGLGFGLCCLCIRALKLSDIDPCNTTTAKTLKVGKKTKNLKSLWHRFNCSTVKCVRISYVAVTMLLVAYNLWCKGSEVTCKDGVTKYSFYEELSEANNCVTDENTNKRIVNDVDDAYWFPKSTVDTTGVEEGNCNEMVRLKEFNPDGTWKEFEKEENPDKFMAMVVNGPFEATRIITCNKFGEEKSTHKEVCNGVFLYNGDAETGELKNAGLGIEHELKCAWRKSTTEDNSDAQPPEHYQEVWC